MPSFAVTGASRGIGLEFIRQLSLNPENSVFAIVRNTSTCQKLRELADATPNVLVFQGDLTDNESLKSAAKSVGEKTGGSLDYLINNAAFIQVDRAHNTLSEYTGREDDLSKDFIKNYQVNVIGVILTVNAFLPLLKKGIAKKVITLTSGLADVDTTLITGFAGHAPYSASKTAVNMINVKYANEFREDNFTFLAISPGLVDTGIIPLTPEELQNVISMGAKFKKAFPDWNGLPITPRESVGLMLGVIERITPAATGAFVSQFGNRQWL